MSATLISGMKERVRIAPRTGATDAYGDEATFGADKVYRAKVTERPRLIKDDKGTEIISKREVWVAARRGVINTDDRVTFDDKTQLFVASVMSMSSFSNRWRIQKLMCSPKNR